MKKIMILLTLVFVLAFFVSAQTNQYYEIELEYDQGEITYTSLRVIPAQKEMETPGANYIAEIIGVEGKTVNLTFFGISTELLYDIVDPETGRIVGGGTKILNESEATLYLPYYPDAQRINIYDFDLNKKLTIPVSSLSQEFFVSEEELEEEIIVGREEPTIEAEPTKRIIVGVLIGLGIFLALIAIIILLRRKAKQQ